MSEPRLEPDEQGVERALGRLRPCAPVGVSAASVLIEVERRRGRWQLWTWRAVAAVLALVLAIQISLPRRQGAPVPVVRPDRVATAGPGSHRTDAPAVDLPLTGDDYISTRNRMIAFGARPARPPASETRPAPKPLERGFGGAEILPTPSLIELLFTNPEAVHS